MTADPAMAAWIGPAIVAAVISALVTAGGWWVTRRQERQRARERRRERVTDIQTALLAEIRASQFQPDDLTIQSAKVVAALQSDPAYTPFVPREVEPAIFQSLLGDLHLLPTAVIDPIVLYYRQVAAVSGLVLDMDTDRFAALESSRKLAIYQDYTALLMHQAVLGRIAAEAIRRSLNIRPDAAAWGPRSGGAPDAASDQSS